MKVLLAGRVSEQITFGRVTTGAADDLSRVTGDRALDGATSTGWGPRSAPIRSPATTPRSPRPCARPATRRCRRSPRRPTAAPPTAHRPPRPARRDRRACCSRSEVIEREEILTLMGGRRDRIEPPSPAYARRRGNAGRGAGHRAAAGTARALQVDSAPGCSGGSITSASPSTTSTRRSPSTRAASGCRSRTARRSTSRASRRSCSTSATCHVELLRPLGPETPVGKFLDRKGPGLHHVAYRVDDIDATLAELREQGIELIDTTPRVGIRDSRVAFVHPRATGCVLTEIVEPAEGH